VSDDVVEYETYERQVRHQLDELEELKQQYQIGIDEDSKTLLSFEERLSVKRHQLDEALIRFVSPFIEEIETLGYRIAASDEEINRLANLRRWRERFEQMSQDLQSIIQKIITIQDRKRELIEQEKAMLASLSAFTGFFQGFISDIYPNFSDARLDHNSFLPIINDHSYKSKSAVQKDIAILGYFYALLRFSLEVGTNIPRFLVVDTLRQDDLDGSMYEKILRKFKDLEHRYTEKFQAFVVTREPMSFLSDDEIVQYNEGEYLLRL
jgi:hypothetical protein